MICKTDLTDELRDAITQLGKEHSIYNGLHEGIGAFKEILALMPDSLETSMFGDVSIESIGLNPALMTSQVHQQANEMLRLYVHVLACNYTHCKLSTCLCANRLRKRRCSLMNCHPYRSNEIGSRKDFGISGSFRCYPNETFQRTQMGYATRYTETDYPIFWRWQQCH